VNAPPGSDFCIDRLYDGECRTEPLDAVIAALAERQHGVVARWQLAGRGIGRGVIEARLRRGSLHLVHRGVYAVGHARLDRWGRWMAAVLACGEDAVLSHRSAGRCWGLLRGSDNAGVDVSRPRGHRRRVGILTHRANLPADERTVVDGVPVTTVPRTIFDIAALGNRREAERTLHEAEVQGLTDRLSLPDLLVRYPGYPGAPLLRELLGIGSGGGATINDFEAVFADLVDRHQLPRPRFNPDLLVRGRHLRPDCVWDERRVIVELDGRAVHGTRRAFESDRERDRILAAEGWRVLRITWRQLADSPEAVVRDVRRTLDVATAFAVA
jgi:very-short-patch-repair endonuclease